MGDPKHIADELSSWLQKVEQAPSLARDCKRDMVLFLDRVVEVVEQSFREILRLSVELRYMTEDELTPTGLRGYLKNVEMLQARDKYRDVEFICGRLHVLKQQFHDGGLDTFTQQFGHEFHRLVNLIDDREGHLVSLAGRFSYEVRELLQQMVQAAEDGRNVKAMHNRLQAEVTSRIQELTAALDQLTEIHHRILPSVGGAGLLDVLLGVQGASATYIDARKQVSIKGDYVAGNQKKVRGNVNTAGRDIVIGSTGKPTSVEQARETLLKAAQNFPASRREEMQKQIDAFTDAINRKCEPSVIQEKAEALEKFLESGKKLLGGPAKAAWRYLKNAAASVCTHGTKPPV